MCHLLASLLNPILNRKGKTIILIRQRHRLSEKSLPGRITTLESLRLQEVFSFFTKIIGLISVLFSIFIRYGENYLFNLYGAEWCFLVLSKLRIIWRRK